MKKAIFVVFFSLAMLGIVSACAAGGGATSDNFPSRNVSGIIIWGAGGTTDLLMRPLAMYTENHLGASIVAQNMTGAAGSIATQFVWDQPADGYTVLMSAENPALHDILGINDITFDNFYPVYVIGYSTVAVVVRADSQFENFDELIDAALADPGAIPFAGTGVGGAPWVASTFIYDITGASFHPIAYENEAAAIMAVMSGESEVTTVLLPSIMDHYLAGSVNLLAVMSAEPVAGLEHVPPIVEYFPDFSRILPWGPFYAVFVREDTDSDVVDVLTTAFAAGGASESYQELLVQLGVNPLGLTGDAAQDFVNTWQANTVQSVISSGALD